MTQLLDSSSATAMKAELTAASNAIVDKYTQPVTQPPTIPPTTPPSGTRVLYRDFRVVKVANLGANAITPYWGSQVSTAHLLSVASGLSSEFPGNTATVTDIQQAYPANLLAHRVRMRARYNPGFTTTGNPQGTGGAAAFKVLGPGFHAPSGRATLEIVGNQYQVYCDGPVQNVNSYDANQGSQRCPVASEWADGQFYDYELAMLYLDPKTLRLEFRRWFAGVTRPTAPMLYCNSVNSTTVPPFDRCQLAFYFNQLRLSATGITIQEFEVTTP